MEVLRDLRPLGRLMTLGRRQALLPLALAVALPLVAAACGGSRQAAPLRPESTGPQWPVKTREHVDLWLHGFAMLQEDTARVPLFARGYRERMTVLKNSRNVYTDLDANRDRLARTIAGKPALVGAQFIALYFGSWQELTRAFEYFQTAEGDPRRASNEEAQGIIAFLAQQFPTPEDREFARIFVRALSDESAKFHHDWWVAEQRERSAALARADDLWQDRWRPALQRFLNHTQQASGDLIPSLALGGEGRALPAGRGSQYAVASPSTPDSAEVLLYAFVHEAIGSIAQVAVNDNLTPVQKRNGLADQYGSVGLVRGGAILVERVDPAAAERYARWYLAQAGEPVPSSNALAALAVAFPMPDEMIESIRRQVDIAFGGI